MIAADTHASSSSLRLKRDVKDNRRRRTKVLHSGLGPTEIKDVGKASGSPANSRIRSGVVSRYILTEQIRLIYVISKHHTYSRIP